MNNPKVLAGGILGAAALVWFTPGNPFNTPAVKMVGEAHDRMGGTATHQTAISTPRGQKGGESPQSTTATEQGAGTDHFRENIANQQTSKPGPIGRAWNEAVTGHELGKPSGENATRTKS